MFYNKFLSSLMSSPYFVQDLIKLKRNIIIFYISDAHVYSKNVSEKESGHFPNSQACPWEGVCHVSWPLFFILIWSLCLFNENNFTVKSEGVLNIQLLWETRWWINKVRKKEGGFVLDRRETIWCPARIKAWTNRSWAQSPYARA